MNVSEETLAFWSQGPATTEADKCSNAETVIKKAIDADEVPTFEHRRYTGNKHPDRSWIYYAGIAFIPDTGGLIKNWPEQNYVNGVSRNSDTDRTYKRLIRIMKRLQNKMQSEGVS